MLANDAQRFFRQPIAVLIEGFFTGQDFAPHDAALPARRFGHRGVEYFRRRPPDVGSGAVALDEGNDGMVGDGPVAVPVGDLGADGCAEAAFNLCWHGPQFTTKRPAFAGSLFGRNWRGFYG